ncbi:Calcium-channel protein cch1 [Ceratocystis lukuohia]|uniref:Calcium-channel protein cch1 n=1 Tax=Ceratocystis lukuohia TaxID=2019550 RepID=A0ABR4MGP4_9PEZI
MDSDIAALNLAQQQPGTPDRSSGKQAVASSSKHGSPSHLAGPTFDAAGSSSLSQKSYSDYPYPQLTMQNASSSTGSPRAHRTPPVPVPPLTTSWSTPAKKAQVTKRSNSPIDAASVSFALPPNIKQDRSISPDSAVFNESGRYYDDPYHNPESDAVPLTSRAQPIDGTASGATLQPRSPADSVRRDSFQTVSSYANSPIKGQMLSADDALRPNRQTGYGSSLTPSGSVRRRSRSPSATGALQRAGSVMRAMSERVVNVSGEAEVVEQQLSMNRKSRAPSDDERTSPHVSPVMSPLGMESGYVSQMYSHSPKEKLGNPFEETVPVSESTVPMPNPLKGRSLGIFGPENPLRKWLCTILVKPITEIFILLSIILQLILLTADAAPSVFDDGRGRPQFWGESRMDWAYLVLFIIWSLEMGAHVIVSGFILNAAEYSTVDRQRGVRANIIDKYTTFFQPESHKGKASRTSQAPPPLLRTFTALADNASKEDQKRWQLARRAYLRHGFNRLDFVAVMSFWLSFSLSVTGNEDRHDIYIFRMLSCLRILRLVAITNGTAIILRSLKKAAPLLVRVVFLLIFFWVLFAIIGVQSFKSSLMRHCVWIDPLDPKNISATYANEFAFCGGHLDNTTGVKMPWVYSESGDSLDDLKNGISKGKGYICPRGSYCLQQSNPHNGTVNFDNLLNSMELVFVVMSANTFADIMYYTTNSDYLAAALFFVAGLVIMMLWLTNLVIAVITSAFQVIRTENQGSAFSSKQDIQTETNETQTWQATSLQKFYEKTKFVWISFIVSDLTAQACRTWSMSDETAKSIDNISIIATIALDVEIIFRFIANVKHFFRSYVNLFDFVLAIATTAILLPPIHDNAVLYGWLSVFQILRIYRVVLAVPMTRKLILLVLGDASGIANMFLFVYMMTFFMAIFAVQLFRGAVPEEIDGEGLDITFGNIYNSFLGMYQILSSEDWTTILYNVTSVGKGTSMAVFGAIFFIGWFFLSYFIMINMFVAVIQENFDVSEDEKRLEQVKAFLQRKELGQTTSHQISLATIFSIGRRQKPRDPLDYGPATMEMLLKDALVQEFLAETDNADDSTGSGHGHLNAATTTFLSGGSRGDVKPGFFSSLWGKMVTLFTSREPNPFYSNIRFDPPAGGDTIGGSDPRSIAKKAVLATNARKRAQREYIARYPRYNNSLFIFSPKNPIRRFCQLIVGAGRGSERFEGREPNKYAWYSFSFFIYICIIGMVLLACVATPLFQRQYLEDHDITGRPWYTWCDVFFAGIFTLEAVIKVVADGFFWTPNAYYRSFWGFVDGVVLITLWIYILTLFANDGAVSRAVGAFKALRALRLLNMSDDARETFHSVIVGSFKIISAAFVSMSLLIPFAIYGLTLFSGKLLSCNDGDSDIVMLSECFGEYSNTPYADDWELLSPRVVKNPYFNFDNFGASMFTLFQIISQEGWIDVAFSTTSITEPGYQPISANRPGNAVFFVIYNLMSTVFVLTLFLSVFMRNYTEQTGVAFLTTEQRSWLELRKILRQVSPSKTTHNDHAKPWRIWCHKRAIEKRGVWYSFITTILVLHLILLMTEYYQEPDSWTIGRDILFMVFSLIYVINISVRILGLGWTRFRRSSWDLYSLFVVSGSFITTSALLISSTESDTYVQLHKAFLVAIVLLLIPRNNALHQLFKTAAGSFSAIINLLATWFVFFLMYAIAFTQAFSLTRWGERTSSNINFRNVPNALIMLFRVSMGEGWNQVMEDLADIVPPLCVDEPRFFDSDCGSKPWARFLFVSWNILSMYIFISLFVSLICESFAYVYQKANGLALLEREEIRRFKQAWRLIDPHGTGFITKEQFPRLLGELSGVFEMRVYPHEDSVGQILEDIRDTSADSQHAAFGNINQAKPEINLERLNTRLSQLDVAEIRRRRRRFNIFFEEVMVAADPDKGISFTSVLMILAHYKIISESKSLRLEEFLRRRARLQRVEEEVRRRVVVNFFNMLYWSRKFKRHMEMKRASRMGTVPSLPAIQINRDGNASRSEDNDGQQNIKDGVSSTISNSPTLAVADGSARSSSIHGPSGSNGSNGGINPLSPSGDITYDADSRRTWNGGLAGLHLDTSQHPLSLPRTGSSNSPSTQFASGGSFTFNVRETRPTAGDRRMTAVNSSSAVQDMLDESVWIESLRRSTTVRRNQSRSGRR